MKLLKNRSNLLYLAFLLELVFLFYRKGELGFIWSPLILFTSGLCMAVYPWFLEKYHRANGESNFLEKNIEPLQTKETKKFSPILIGLFSLLVLVGAIWTYLLIQRFPIDINHSDIIPFIDEVYLSRFKRGEALYAQLEGFGYGKFYPGYLPFHWCFFLISSFLQFDHRWIPFAVYIVASGIFVWVSMRNFNELIHKVFILLLPFVLLFSIYGENASDAMHTIEILVIGYYLLAGLSLFSKSFWAQSFGLLFPLLSRYSLVFWLPVHFLSMWPKDKKRFFSVGFLLLGLIVICLLPFWLQTPEMFSGFGQVYQKAAMGEWNGQAWQQPGDKPFQLFRGLGFASWFYEYYPGTLEQKIAALNKTLLYVSVLVTLLLLIFSSKIRKVVSPNLFSLLALKFSLTWFYAFMIIPYNYLNWVPMAISIVILSRLKNPLFHRSLK